MVYTFYDILMHLPGFNTIYLYLRKLLYSKRHPGSYRQLPISESTASLDQYSYEIAADAHGIRLSVGEDLPVSVVQSRDTLPDEGNNITPSIDQNHLVLPVGDERLYISIHSNNDWLKIQLDHHFDFAFGLAEKHGSLNKMGKEWQIWNTDVAWMEPDDDPLYKNYPILLLTNRSTWLALIVDYPGYQNWDLRKEGQLDIHLKSDRFILDVLIAEDSQSLLGKIRHLLGGMELPPQWTLGYHQCRWSYFPAAQVEEIATTFRTKDIPIDAIYLDIDYMDGFRCFTYDETKFGDLPALVNTLHDQHFKVVVMIDPGLKLDDDYFVYDQGKKLDAFVKNDKHQDFAGPVWPGKSVFPDFFNQKVRNWWGNLYEYFVREVGIDGFWNDMNEPSIFTLRGTMPDDLIHRLDDGTEVRHDQVHNLYGQMMARASYNGLKQISPNKRVFLLSRSAYLGSQQYGWIWSGDNKSAWDHLAESIPKIINSGLSGHFASGPDIGGFREVATPELYARWIQLGVFYPFMRTHSIKFVDHQEPWSFGTEVEEISRQMIKLRYQLLPYIYTYFRKGCLEGIPLMRPMWMEFPDDDPCWDEAIFNQQFMFGPDMLVAPVLKEGEREVSLYLPEGRWYHYFDNTVYTGGKNIIVDAELDQINIFVREGSIIPIYKEVGNNVEQTKLSGLDYLKFGDNPAGILYLDDGISYDYQDGKYGLYAINSNLSLELLAGLGHDSSS